MVFRSSNHLPDTKSSITDVRPSLSAPGAISMTPTECSRMKVGSFSHDAPSLLGIRSNAELIRLPSIRSASR